ncbi:hypothetical protein PENNAL_c0017G07997 [Penicillium nalgiovense]|uniref:Kinesin light chain n=1 Tax=Penicillium nalgiovense TaxID=60175 RepID=A0A1V6YLJ4_PENNA|nr:hypothetical protein PENNAL_c0017G07997 [Penicillium nalgiovense]
MLQQAFELHKNAFSSHHEDTLCSLEALGDALCGQEMYAEAEGVYRDVWEARKRAFGTHHKDTLASLSALVCFKHLLVLEFVKAFALLQGRWTDESWMAQLKHECYKQAEKLREAEVNKDGNHKR